MEPVATVDKSIFSKYPINHYGEIWDKLTRLDFAKNAVLPKEVLCFLEKGTVRKYFADNRKELSTEISLDFYFEGDIFTAKADSGLVQEFNYESIEEGTL